MKSKEVLKILGISRPTLTCYIKDGKIKGTLMKNGYYDYDEDSVYEFLGRKKERVNIIYARVSTYKQKKDLENQVNKLINHCEINEIEISNVYQEIASGIDFERKEFSTIMQLVFERKIDKIYITFKDRISRLSFMTLENIFKQFGTSIVVLNKNNIGYSDELFEELLNVIHLFSTRTYSNRRKLFKEINFIMLICQKRHVNLHNINV